MEEWPDSLECAFFREKEEVLYTKLYTCIFPFLLTYKVTVNLNSLPVEIHAQILSYLDPIDCLSYGKVCRVTARAAECNQVWKRQWLKLSKETPFIFLNDLDQLSGTSSSLFFEHFQKTQGLLAKTQFSFDLWGLIFRGL